MAHPADELTADALAYVCAHRDELRDELRRIGNGDEELLDTLLDTLLAGTAEAAETWTGLLDRVHDVLQAAGDAQGLYGRGTAGWSARELRPAGVDRMPVSETVFLCPAGRCTRRWWPEAGADTPDCGIDGRRLRRARL